MTTYGSQGQQRLATLALKFAAREHLRGETGQDPILLFDDVMSELDEERRGYLTDYFLGSTQAVISTTNLEYFDPKVLDRVRVVRISGVLSSRPPKLVQRTGIAKPKTAYISPKTAEGPLGKRTRRVTIHGCNTTIKRLVLAMPAEPATGRIRIFGG